MTGLRLVPVMLRLVRPLLRHADVPRLHVGELRELGAELGELQPRDFLIEMLRQHVHADGILRGLREQFDLREHLIGE